MLYEESADIDYGLAAEPEAAAAVNKELNIARRLVEETGANLFLTGKAGTGKTTFLKNLSLRSQKRMIVLAPTGVAAINAGGMTIHSFFQLPFSPYIPGQGFVTEDKKFNRFSKEKRRLITSLDLLVIDEVSMVRPDTLDAIDSILQRLRSNTAPFGGVQLLLIGDLRQLAPVVKPQEWSFLAPHYASPYFFESHALKTAGFYTVELQTIYRQQDQEFISILNEVRDGKATSKTLQSLNKKYLSPSEEEQAGNAICLTTHNRTSDQINLMHLAALEGEVYSYEAVITGKFPEFSYPADFILNLKLGARVMFIKNDTGIERRYYNGLIGTVTELTSKHVVVTPDDSELAPIEIGIVEWDNISYKINEETKKIEEIVEGSFWQIPLRLAWAITIHKSQGLTFDKAIIDANQSFAPGQLYVALSRCRTLQGMYLKSQLTNEAVIVDPTVNSFIEYASGTAPDEERMALLRDEFFRKQLAELFDFVPMKFAFEDFARAVKEYIAPTFPFLYDRYKNGELYLQQKILEVGNRFNATYTTSRLDSEHTLSNEAFRQKIAGGCRYFLDCMEKFTDLLNSTPMNLDNQEYQRRVDNAVELLRFHIIIKRKLLEGIKEEGFSVPLVLRLKAEAAIEATREEPKKRVKKTRQELQEETEDKIIKRQKQAQDRAKRKADINAKKRPKGYSQRESLAMFRDGLSIPQIAYERGLADNTVAGHLAEMVGLNELQLEDILTANELNLLQNAESELRLHKLTPNFNNLRDQLEGLLPQYLVSLYAKAKS